MSSRELEAQKLQREWETSPRWKGIKRGYTAEDVVRLRGSIQIEHTLAKRGSEKLWKLLNEEPFINALGALTGNQAMQQVKAGLKAIYLSGWQVAGDANLAGEMYPDQSLYPANSVPQVVKRINNTFTRADQIQWSEGKNDIDFFAPIVADAEAGFGGVLNAFELMKAMIEAGASGVHFEDQLASVKKCGHMGGKVLVPATWTTPTSPSAPASARWKASTAPSPVWIRPSAAVWPMRPTQTSCGARPASRTWPTPRPLPKPSTSTSRARCWPTTARRPSTGRRTWTTRRLPSSSANSVPWATSSSSSPWPASTA